MNTVLMSYGGGFRVELLTDLRKELLTDLIITRVIKTRGYYCQGVFLK